ncbi:hypothetical protein ACWDUN_12195 [Mycobacterium sp. NPDC003323]
MSSSRALQLTVGFAAVGAALLAVAATAGAEPETDNQGYLQSFARCAAPATAVIFGSTATSRVAICEDADGALEYRGVRVRDGAQLSLPATRSGDGYVAFNDGQSYTVTSESLVFSVGDDVVRTEDLTDVHEPGATSSDTSTTPSTASSTTAPATTTPATTTAVTTTTTPLPPPGPAEIGGQLGEVFSGGPR